jgi:hypothetical protein
MVSGQWDGGHCTTTSRLYSRLRSEELIFEDIIMSPTNGELMMECDGADSGATDRAFFVFESGFWTAAGEVIIEYHPTHGTPRQVHRHDDPRPHCPAGPETGVFGA